MAGAVQRWYRYIRARIVQAAGPVDGRPHRIGGPTSGRTGVQRRTGERRRRDAARTEGLAFFHAVFDGTNDAILIVDPSNGSVADANTSAMRMLGYDRAELRRLNIYDIHPEDPERIRQFARQVMKTGEQRWDGFTYRTKAGADVPVEMAASRIETGGRSLIVAVARDIAERKRAEDALRRSEERYRRLVEVMPDAIVVQCDGKIVFANPATVDLLGAETADQLIGKEAMNFVHPDNREAGRERVRQIVEQGKGASAIEFTLLRLDGTTVDAEIVSLPFSHQGRPAVQTVIRDITDRKRAEIALRQSDDLMRTMAEATPVPLFVTRMSDGEVLFANRWVGPALGLEPEDVAGRSMRNFYASPKDRAMLLDAIEADGYVQNHEMQIRRADGQVISTVHSVRKATYQGEDVLMGGFYDITELKKADEKRRRAEERLRDAIESIPDGLVLFDEGDRVVTWNSRFAELYPELEPLLPNRPTAEDMFRARHQAGAVGEFDVPADEYVAWRMEMRQKQGGTPAVHRHDDGRWFRTTERKTREGGIVAISTDITELKLAQTRLTEAIESISQGFAYFDSDNRLAFCNENYRNRWPAVRDRIVSGIAFSDLAGLLWDHGYVRGASLDKEAWLKERLRQQSESAVVDREISPGTWIRMNEHPIRDGGFVQIVTDITESVRAEAELRAARDQAEFASRTKTEFLANVSHELRTPLNAINGFSEIMADEMFGPMGDARYLDYAQDIYQSGTHLLALINDILDLSKIEAGKLELDEQDVDVSEAIHSCLRIVTERAKEGKVGVATEIDANLPGLLADPRAIKQIVINLLSNAIKFTPPGGKVTTRAGVAGDGRFVISVSDTGIGIAAEDIATTLAPFGQVDGSLSRKHEGTGLGLPLVKSLVELHGGTLEIVSQPGIGTNVHARFPAARILERTEGAKEPAGAA